MASFTLSSYTVKVLRRDDDEPIRLGDVGEGSVRSTLLDFLEEYHAEDTYALDQDRQRLFRVPHLGENGSDVGGIVETGDYGYEAPLIDVETGKQSHTRARTEAELLPFYFLARLPGDRKTGILLLQRFKQFGMKTAVWNTFRKTFNRTFPNHRLELDPVVPSELFERYLDKGQIMKVRLLRNDVPSDIADVHTYGIEEDMAYTEYIIHARRNHRFGGLVDRLKGVIKGEVLPTEFVEVSGFDYDKAKVELDVEGSRRTIDLSDTGRIRPYLDITEEVELGDDGHPTVSSLETVSKGWVEAIWSDYKDLDDQQD